MTLKQEYYPESAFGGFSRVDGTVAFYCRVRSLAQPESVVLDVGCGRGAAAGRLAASAGEKYRVLKGYCRKVIGIDVDPAGYENPLIDEFRRIEGDRWPVDTSSIDILVSDAVLEHLREPEAFFSECRRVVKPGGYICFRTPNRWNYVPIAASLIPNRLHSKVVSVVQPGRKELDVFPTYYHANTGRRLRGLLKQFDFEGCVYPHIAEPNYFAFSRWAYFFGIWMHRLLPPLFWPVLFVFAKKRQTEPCGNCSEKPELVQSSE
jgi:SAM-dependent methyltransferase